MDSGRVIVLVRKLFKAYLSLTLMQVNLVVRMLGFKLLTICSLLFGASSFPDLETSPYKKDTPFYENLCDEVIVRKTEAEIQRVKSL